MSNLSITATPPSKTPVLVAICLAAIILPLSFVSGSIATPVIGRELGGSAQALSWITNAFMLSFGCFLMAAGALADEIGRKKVFIVGVSLFALLSGLIGFSSNLLWIDVMRAAQGVAAAAALAGGSASLAHEFSGRAQTRAFSLLGSSFGIGLAFGPFLAGLLIAHFGWRSVFLSSMVIALLSLSIGVTRLNESKNPNAAGIDWPGTLLFTAMLALLTWGLMDIPVKGVASFEVITLLLATLVLLVLFIVVERKVSHPMLDLSLFRYARFIGVQALPLATAFGFVVLLVLLPMQFIGIAGMSEEQAGLMMMALSLPMLVVPLLAAFLTRWISSGIVCTGGLLIAALGLVWLSQSIASQNMLATLLPMTVIGIGIGLPWGLMDGLSISVVPKERAGMATGIFSTTRVAGEGIALAIVGAMLAGFVGQGIAKITPNSDSASASVAIQRLAIGDLHQTQRVLPQASAQQLTEIYAGALHHLLLWLAALTLISAVIVYVALCLKKHIAPQPVNEALYQQDQ
ncbi:MFS transporter [Rouxiella silvae]|uniref:MFS transporter n=1 Tax=Rouxiella silvae TaxID=1646373 RepID=A0ABX3TVT0_9GAMM|nr:MFS transporter [Rouxiella silvae]ORJ19340.1 MFS transporter [Rouxiella silvae]